MPGTVIGMIGHGPLGFHEVSEPTPSPEGDRADAHARAVFGSLDERIRTPEAVRPT